MACKCRRSDSNRHGPRARWILNPVRLPISPLRLKMVYFSTFSVWESSAKWTHARDDCAFNDLRRQDPICDLMIVDCARQSVGFHSRFGSFERNETSKVFFTVRDFFRTFVQPNLRAAMALHRRQERSRFGDRSYRVLHRVSPNEMIVSLYALLFK